MFLNLHQFCRRRILSTLKMLLPRNRRIMYALVNLHFETILNLWELYRLPLIILS
jgi:hypothetical protein